MSIARVETVARDGLLPRCDLVQPFDSDDAERRGELMHAVVQTWLRKSRLAVLPVGASELEQLRIPADEHPAFAGRDRLRRCERPQPRLTPSPGAAPVPRCAVCMGA